MSLIMPLSLMNRHDRINEDINKRTKAFARATSMAGIIVAAALLSGLLFLFSSNTQSVLAQQAKHDRHKCHYNGRWWRGTAFWL